MVRPGAPVVARLGRGRRSKAEPSPSSAVVADGSYDKLRDKTKSAAAREPVEPSLHPIQERGGIPWNALSIAAAVIAFLCIFRLVSFGASPMHVADQASPPRSLAEASLGIDGFFDWFNNMPWTNRPGEAEKEVETVNSIQPVVDESLWKSPDSACPQCAACDDSIVHATEQEVVMGRVKDPFPPVLALVTFRFPAVSNFMRRLVKLCHDFIDDHLWISFLWTVCGAWKAMELLLALVRTAGGPVLDCAERIAERLRQDESMAEKGIDDDDSEKARGEAEQRLLLRMKVTEKEKE